MILVEAVVLVEVVIEGVLNVVDLDFPGISVDDNSKLVVEIVDDLFVVEIVVESLVVFEFLVFIEVDAVLDISAVVGISVVDISVVVGIEVDAGTSVVSGVEVGMTLVV